MLLNKKPKSISVVAAVAVAVSALALTLAAVAHRRCKKIGTVINFRSQILQASAKILLFFGFD